MISTFSQKSVKTHRTYSHCLQKCRHVGDKRILLAFVQPWQWQKFAEWIRLTPWENSCCPFRMRGLWISLHMRVPSLWLARRRCSGCWLLQLFIAPDFASVSLTSQPASIRGRHRVLCISNFPLFTPRKPTWDGLSLTPTENCPLHSESCRRTHSALCSYYSSGKFSH